MNPNEIVREYIDERGVRVFVTAEGRRWTERTCTDASSPTNEGAVGEICDNAVWFTIRSTDK